MAPDSSSPFYPPVAPYRSGLLPVSELHSIYFEESGNPEGKPVVFLHGGPGGGTEPKMRQYFDPSVYRIVLLDQRGCGKSTPHACLEDNTTWALIADVEKARAHIGIESWQVFGGSWGSTLALAYAVTHPERVTELVLRGIFLLRHQELSWFYQRGADAVFPDYWEDFLAPIPLEERGDMMTAYYKRLTSTDSAVRSEAAKAWSIWEGRTSKLHTDPSFVERFAGDEFSLAFARIEAHYFVNRGFLPYEGWLLDKAQEKLQEIPTVIIQGRYDLVCPMESAWALKKRLPHAELFVIGDAGHSASEPGIAKALVEATDRYGKR